MTPPFRRRLENALLRWQGRLDSTWSDRVLPWAFTAIGFVIFLLPALARSRSLEENDDLAATLQAAWLIRRGEPPMLTVGGEVGAEHLLASQFSVLFYPVAWLTGLLPSVGTVVTLHALALAVGVIPLWWLCRRAASLRVGVAASLVVVYLCFPALHDVAVAGAHSEALALPALLGATYVALTGRTRWFWVLAVVVVLARADFGLAVAGVGVVLVLTGRGRFGWQAVVAGVGWTAVVGLVVQPLVGDGTYPHIDAFAAYGSTPAGVLWGLLSSPVEVLGDLFRVRTFRLAVGLFGPLLFLPLLAPRLLVGVVPLQALFLVADVPEAALRGPMAVPLTSFAFVATAFALARLGRMGVEKIRVDPRLLAALVVAGALYFVVDAGSSPATAPWNPTGDERARVVRDALDGGVPRDAAVRAPGTMLVPLAERAVLHRWDPDERVTAVEVAEEVDVVVVDELLIEDWSAARRSALERGLTARGFTEVAQAAGVVVWRAEGPGTAR